MTDGRLDHTEEVRHFPLGQPKGLSLKQNLDTHIPFRRGVEDNLVIRWSLVVVWTVRHLRSLPACLCSVNPLLFPTDQQ